VEVDIWAKLLDNSHP